MKCYKIGELIPDLGQKCSCISMTCRTKTETVSRMQKAGPFDCCCSHRPVASPSLSRDGHFEHIL